MNSESEIEMSILIHSKRQIPRLKKLLFQALDDYCDLSYANIIRCQTTFKSKILNNEAQQYLIELVQ